MMRPISDRPPAPPTVTRVTADEESAARDPVPVNMPEGKAQAARDIEAVSAEGRPADARAGPGKLMIQMAMLVGVIVLAAAALGWWAGWMYGGVALVLGLLAVLFNPVMGATALRVQDRQIAADNERATDLHTPSETRT